MHYPGPRTIDFDDVHALNRHFLSLLRQDRRIARRVVGSTEAAVVTAEVLEYIRAELPAHYEWPGNVRELEQCVRNVVIRRVYRPAVPDSERRSMVVDLTATNLSAEALLERYCFALYRRSGSFVEAGRRAGLDRRTIKSKVEAYRRRSL